MVRRWLVLPAKFVAAAMASSSASVADTTGQAVSYANPPADSKANTYAAADAGAYPDSPA
jgi:hypothetical protein